MSVKAKCKIVVWVPDITVSELTRDRLSSYVLQTEGLAPGSAAQREY